MITRTVVVILGYLCVAGSIANGQQNCNATNFCPSTQQCIKPYSFCNLGDCACSAGLKFNTSTCVTPMVNVGGNCSLTSDCKGTNTYCNNQCVCISSSYTVNGDKSDCTLVSTPSATSLNSTCNTTNPACGLGTSCTLNNNKTTCQCIPAFTPVGGSNNVDCRPMMLNDPCSNVTDCGPNSQSNPACKNANCNNGTYQCNSGYWWVTSDTISFQGGCVPTNVAANVASGQPCADGTGNNNYKLCAAGLTCAQCFENPIGTGTCQPSSTLTTTTTQKPGGASNVQVNILALVAALAFFRFAA